MLASRRQNVAKYFIVVKTKSLDIRIYLLYGSRMKTAKQVRRQVLRKKQISPLKFKRIEAGLRLAEAAPAIGIDISYLCLLENHKRNITLDMAKKLAKFYGTTIQEIFP